MNSIKLRSIRKSEDRLKDINRIAEDQQRLLNEDHQDDGDDGDDGDDNTQSDQIDDLTKDYRKIQLNGLNKGKYPTNIVKNQKYNLISFIPYVLYEQFKFFFNLYFLLVALSQFIPPLKIG